MSVIRRLLWNEDFISSINDSSEEEKTEARIQELRKELIFKMDPQQEKNLDKFCSEINIRNEYECERAFFLGFKSALKLMSDVTAKDIKNK